MPIITPNNVVGFGHLVMVAPLVFHSFQNLLTGLIVAVHDPTYPVFSGSHNQNHMVKRFFLPTFD